MDDKGMELADRVRSLLMAEPGLEEKRMFGTRAFLRGGRILVCARGDGDLLVRVGVERGSVLLGEPGASIAVMGAKSMTPSWLDVDAAAVVEDEALLFWVAAAREFADQESSD